MKVCSHEQEVPITVFFLEMWTYFVLLWNGFSSRNCTPDKL